MLEKAIKVKSVETTTGGTQIVEFYPVAYSRWIQTPELSEAEVAVQPYGVLMIPAAVVLDSEGLIVQVAIHDYIFEAPLSTIIAADAEDSITFASPYLTLKDLQDVTITSVENGQVLKWNSTAGKWINGAGGGGETGYSVTTTTIANETITLTEDSSGDIPTYYGTFSQSLNLIDGQEYIVTINNEEPFTVIAADDDGSVGFAFLGDINGWIYDEDGVSFLGDINGWIYDEDGVSYYMQALEGASAHVKIEQTSVTTTNDFELAVNSLATKIQYLYIDPNEQGTALAPGDVYKDRGITPYNNLQELAEIVDKPTILINKDTSALIYPVCSLNMNDSVVGWKYIREYNGSISVIYVGLPNTEG